MFHQTTKNILVSVMPAYIDERSKPEEGLYFWAYRVTIKNNSENSIQILKRFWQISNNMGQIETVEGEGIVGEKPHINPGDFYEYTSGCPLNTNSGIMVGQYEAIHQNGKKLMIDIPAFSLDLPDSNPVYN